MSTYVLNLMMGNPASSTDAQAGRFNSSSVDPNSKVWFQLAANNPWPTPDPPGQQVKMSTNPFLNMQNQPTFSDAQSFNCNLSDLIYVRVAADSSWGNTPPVQVTLAANFGRPDTSRHDGDTIPSPFLSPSVLAAVPVTNVVLGSALPTNPASNDWIIFLGAAKQNALGGAPIPSGGATSLRIYSFIVTAVASTAAGVVGNYGHDPQMIVIG